IWNSIIPTRIAFFIWKTVFKGISVDQNIQRRGIPLASKCRCCLNSNVETLEHLLFQGDVAINIGDTSAKLLISPRVGICPPYMLIGLTKSTYRVSSAWSPLP
ncbi:zf-RVT domain-containing protein, partial [Cephalotus follicularis]